MQLTPVRRHLPPLAATRRHSPPPAATRRHSPQGHPDKVLCVAYSPDSRQLASCGEDDGAVRVYDTRTGRCTAVLQPQQEAAQPQPQAKAADGDAGEAGPAAAAAAAPAPATGHAPGKSCRAVAWSPDGRRLASGGDDCRLLLWDAATGQVTHELAGGHQGGVYGLAFGPGGARLASCGGDKAIRIWDVASGAQVSVLAGHNMTVRCVAWSHSGRHLASAGEDCTARVWRAAAGREVEAGVEVAKLDDFDDDVNAVAWSPDDLTLVSWWVMVGGDME